VSRYNFDGEQDQSHGTVILLTPLAGSRYRRYKVVKGAGIKAKTMTSLLILTGVVSKSVVNFLSTTIIIKGTILFFLVIEMNLCSSSGLSDFIKA